MESSRQHRILRDSIVQSRSDGSLTYAFLFFFFLLFPSFFFWVIARAIAAETNLLKVLSKAQASSNKQLKRFFAASNGANAQATMVDEPEA